MNLSDAFKLAVGGFGLIGFALASLATYSFYEACKPVYDKNMLPADRIGFVVMVAGCLAVAANSFWVMASVITK